MANEKGTSQLSIVWGGSPRRWVMNADEINPALAGTLVRVNQRFTDAQAIELLKKTETANAAKEAASKGMACACTGSNTQPYMPIPVPGNQLRLNGIAGPQVLSFGVTNVASQVAEMMTRAATYEARNKPAYGSEISTVSANGTDARLTITLANKKRFLVTVTEIVEK